MDISDLTPLSIVLLILLIVWDFAWKALAMWRAAKLDEKGWFIALWVLNTAGILPILYIFVFSAHDSVNKHQHSHSS